MANLLIESTREFSVSAKSGGFFGIALQSLAVEESNTIHSLGNGIHVKCEEINTSEGSESR